MKSIILTGMMGCGKTTCARLLAQQLGRELWDTDTQIVARTGRTIADIFARDGEEAFRELETQVCRELSGRRDLVVATGGGLVLRRENVELLHESGIVVFLNRPAGEIYDSMSKAGRPLAQDGRDAFLTRFAQREPVYRAAAQVEITEFSSPAATARAVLERLDTKEDVL